MCIDECKVPGTNKNSRNGAQCNSVSLKLQNLKLDLSFLIDSRALVSFISVFLFIKLRLVTVSLTAVFCSPLMVTLFPSCPQIIFCVIGAKKSSSFSILFLDYWCLHNAFKSLCLSILSLSVTESSLSFRYLTYFRVLCNTPVCCFSNSNSS